MRVALLARLDNVDHAHLPELPHHVRSIEIVGLEGIIRLDATDKVWGAQLEHRHQLVERVLELPSNSCYAPCPAATRASTSAAATTAVREAHGAAHGAFPGRTAAGTRTLFAAKEALDKGHLGGGQELRQLGRQRIPTLVDESKNLIVDVACVVRDDETLAASAGECLEGGRGAMALLHLGEQVSVRGVRYHYLLVDKRHETRGLHFEKRHHLRVVSEGELRAGNALGAALLLLHLEDVYVEMLLQLLVGEVDKQLLERVANKGLEAKDVQQADNAPSVGAPTAAGVHFIVYLCKHPVKERTV
mmetsp:Transcript_11386/g.35133  ORF Transcript_11386/g.35133 Transcript_11386/m.35133 type:complete len:303 (+) Transcript_11386:3929-4837(+)